MWPHDQCTVPIMYASIMSRETVRMALMIAVLNDLEFLLGNVLNAYVQASVTKKVWVTLGPEFCKDAGKTAVIVRALNGLKSSGAALRSHLLNAWNLWGMRPVRLTKIYGMYQKSDQKMG